MTTNDEPSSFSVNNHDKKANGDAVVAVAVAAASCMTTTTTTTTCAPATNNDNNNKTLQQQQETTFSEWMMPGLKMEMKSIVLAHQESKYQDIQVLDTFFGKTLVLDGYTQSTQHDEFVYHESLVHPAMLWATINNNNTPPRRVFIGGGGELATARQVLRYPTVESVVMVDLDETVVQLSQMWLPEFGGTAVLNDPRLQLVIGDAHEYLMTLIRQQSQKKEANGGDGDTNKNDESLLFDVIIMDISDPVEAGPGVCLYTQEFYQQAATLLAAPHGVLVTQGGPADAVPYQIDDQQPLGHGMSLGPIRNTLAQVFGHALVYSTHIASFGGDWGFVMALKKASHNSDNNSKDTATTTDARVDSWKYAATDTVDALLGQYIPGGAQSMRHYDGESHRRMFALTKPLRLYLEGDERIMTMDNPIYTF